MNRLYFSVKVIFIASLLLGCGGGSENKEKVVSDSPEATNERPLAAIDPQARLNYYSSLPETVIDESKKYVATIRTNKGDIVVELDASTAPLHTNNLVFLARQGFYDGLTFHRVVPNFVIQGGDPLGRGSGGPGYKIPAEIALPHHQGVIAMARQSTQVNPQRMSSGSQFYITLAPQPHLDQDGYSVFGHVIEGFDIVLKIQKGDVINRIDVEER